MSDATLTANGLTAKEWFRALKPLALFDTGALSAGDTVVMADNPIAVELRRRFGDSIDRAVWTMREGEPIPDPPKVARRLLVATLQNELAIAAEFRRKHPACHVRAATAEAAVLAAAGADPWQPIEESGVVPAPDLSYCIVCTARSGSTYLCNLLQNTGRLGNPKEHLRPPVIFLQKNKRRFTFELANWIDRTIAANTVNGIFGTKLVDDFINAMTPLLTASDLAALQERTDAMRIIRLVRRDRVEQAVSKFLAEKTRIWHARQPTDLAAYRETAAEVPYSGPEIRRFYDEICRNEDTISKTLRSLNRRALTIHYEDVVSDPHTSMERIGHFLLGDRGKDLHVKHDRFQRMGNEQSAAFAERFRTDYGL